MANQSIPKRHERPVTGIIDHNNFEIIDLEAQPASHQNSQGYSAAQLQKLPTKTGVPEKPQSHAKNPVSRMLILGILVSAFAALATGFAMLGVYLDQKNQEGAQG